MERKDRVHALELAATQKDAVPPNEHSPKQRVKYDGPSVEPGKHAGTEELGRVHYNEFKAPVQSCLYLGAHFLTTNREE